MQQTKYSPSEYLNLIATSFSEKGNPEVAQGQMKYMRFHFEFYGLKAPVWLPMTKQAFKGYGLFDGEQLKTFTRLCLDQDYREIHYFSIEMVQKQLKHQDESFIDFLEEMILTKSWWDSVDWVIKLVTLHFRKYPKDRDATAWKWARSSNFWLNRSAILIQLKNKDLTDPELLFALILHHRDSKEFFIQKGAGWALREYSKTNAAAVIDFISKNELPSLTKREGLKWVTKQGLIDG